MSDLGWWAIHGDTIMQALRAVAAGEDPDLVYAELYANARSEDVPPHDGSQAATLIARARALFTDRAGGFVEAREVARDLADYLETIIDTPRGA